MEAAGSSDTLVPTHQTTWCHIPEAHDFNIHHSGDQKPQPIFDI
jgi:hypothetical protein